MALEIVKPESTFLLPYEEMNRAGELLAMARGIAACVGVAAKHEDQMPEFSITQACYALSELLDQVQKITEMKTERQV